MLPGLPLAPVSPSLAALRRGWAQLIRQVYEVDPLVCPRCQGVMRVVAFVTEPRVIRRILDHLAAPAPTPSQGRAPPPVALPAPVLPCCPAGQRRLRPSASPSPKIRLPILRRREEHLAHPSRARDPTALALAAEPPSTENADSR